MAEIPVRTATVNGVNLNLQPAASGDFAKCGKGYTLIVANGSVSECDVTIAVPGNTAWGPAQPDKVVAVPAGQTWPIPLYDIYRDEDGFAHITWESTTTITRAVLKS